MILKLTDCLIIKLGFRHQKVTISLAAAGSNVLLIMLCLAAKNDDFGDKMFGSSGLMLTLLFLVAKSEVKSVSLQNF